MEHHGSRYNLMILGRADNKLSMRRVEDSNL